MAAAEEQRVGCRELPGGASPTSVLALLRDDPHPFALTGNWAGCEAVLGSRPVAIRTGAGELGPIFGDAITDAQPTGTRMRCHGPPQRHHHHPIQPSRAAPAFGGGWIGYLGYAIGGRLHALPPAPGGPRQLPECWFGYYDHVLVRRTGRWFFEELTSTAGAGQDGTTPARQAGLDARYAELSSAMAELGAGDSQELPYQCGEFEVTPSPVEHRLAVARAVELIRAGDMFQANITLRLEAAFDGDPLDLFCRGSGRLNPPYAAFLRLDGDRAIASFSPELFLRRTGRDVLHQSDQGHQRAFTRTGDSEPAARRAHRLGQEQSRERDDRGLDAQRLVRRLPARHGVGAAIGRGRAASWPVAPGVRCSRRGWPAARTDTDLIAATFPPGSVTGAPKVRAMEVISSLEPTPARGLHRRDRLSQRGRGPGAERGDPHVRVRRRAGLAGRRRRHRGRLRSWPPSTQNAWSSLGR